MATPTVRQVVTAHTSGGSASVATGTGTAVGDYLVVFHAEDWVTLADMTAPGGTAGTWAMQISADMGANSTHVKVWTRPVTVGGAQTVTCPSHSGDEVLIHVYVVSGVAAINDGAAATTTTGTVSAAFTATAPSVTTTGSDDLLLCAWISGDSSLFDTISAPPEMTNGVLDNNFISLFSARQALTASGATGTRSTTNTTPDGRTYIACSLAIKGAAAASPAFRGWGVPI